MYRLSLIISEIYNKYLPLAEKDGIILNLDFSDTTREISDPERVKAYLDEHLDSTLKRSSKGEVTIGVNKSAISITDSATTLSPAVCALLSNRYIDVKSRVGFGTTVQIFFSPRTDATPVETPSKPHIEGIGVSAQLDQSTQQPVLAGEVKLATQEGKQRSALGARLQLTGQKSAAPAKPSLIAKTTRPTKTTKSTSPNKSATKQSTSRPQPVKKSASLSQRRAQRQIVAAAKKADREVKRIAKKAEKQAKKLARTTKNTTAKVTKDTPKAKITTQKTTKYIKPTRTTTKPQTSTKSTTPKKTKRRLRLS